METDTIQQRILDEVIHASSEAKKGNLFKIDPSGLNEAWVGSYVGVNLNDLLRSKFANPSGIFVTFETTVDYIDCFFGREEIHWLTHGQKFDLLLWGERFPFALVEIKHSRHFDQWNAKNDAGKIAGALERWPEMSAGYFVFSSTSPRRSHTRQSEFDDRVSQDGLKSEWVERGMDGAYWHCSRVTRPRQSKLS